MIPPPPRSTLFPYTTLFRSSRWVETADPSVTNLFACKGGNNMTGHCDPELDKLLMASDQELDPAKRKPRSEEHTSELQSQSNLVCRLLLEKKKQSRAAPART